MWPVVILNCFSFITMLKLLTKELHVLRRTYTLCKLWYRRIPKGESNGLSESNGYSKLKLILSLPIKSRK